jgi:stage V sporulation protein D (sporulation-specific penicillin-binding protein)
LLFLYSFIGIALVLRLGWIQIVQGDFYKKEAFLHQTRDTIFSPKRGSIYDRNGKELAISVEVYTISVDPFLMKKTAMNLDSVASKLSEILSVNKDDVLKKLGKIKSQYEVVSRKVEKEKSEKIRDWIKDKKVKGVYIEKDSKRYYGGKNLAAHVIGFTNMESEGIYGVERMMNEYLKGKPGKILSEVDTKGNQVPFAEDGRVEPEDGANVVLTIDEVIQHITEEALDKAIRDNKVLDGACAIVMDPRNGEILSMVSKPDFDLNEPFAAPPGADKNTWKGTTTEDVKTLMGNVWRDRAIVDTYEPGSTFKAITSAMGLEEGIVNPDSPVNDFTITMRGRQIKCHEPNKHGNETFREGLYHSCNPVFTTLSLQLGLDRFYKYVRAFGFYDKTGIDLPDESGSNFHAKPDTLDMAVAAFGQRFEITPIQLIQAYGAIANGGKLIKPHVVREVTDSEGNIIKRVEPEVVRNTVSTETCDTLKDMLEGVVADPRGTGGTAYVTGYRVAGKTATAETLDKDKYVASFAAIAPVDNPVICVLVVLKSPKGVSHGGGYTAGPAVAKIIEGTLDYLGVEKKYSELDKRLLAKDIYVPDVTNTDFEQAVAILKERKLEYIREDKENSSSEKIYVQSPKPGERVREGSAIVLYTYKPDKEINVRVPDLRNKDIFEATQNLNNLGLNIKANGIGVAVGQSVEAGKEVKKGTAIEVEFKPDDPEAQTQ